MPGRTLDAILAHIAIGSEPLKTPHTDDYSPRRELRRTELSPLCSSSTLCLTQSLPGMSSSFTRSASPYARPALLRVQRLEFGSRALTVNSCSHSASLRLASASRRVKMHTFSLWLAELRAAQLEYVSPDDLDGVSAVIEVSKNDILPMTLSKACAWSFADHARITKTCLLDLSNEDRGHNDDLFGRDTNESEPGTTSGIKDEEYDVLTRCYCVSSLFSSVFCFRKVIKKIFSELGETKTQGPILPDDTSQTYL